MTIANRLNKKYLNKKYKNLLIEGINGSGKTTFLRKIYIPFIINNFLWDIFYIKKKKTSVFFFLKFNLTNYKGMIEFCTVLNINKWMFSKKIEDFSSGQKKKLLFATLVASKSFLWYMDEPKSYIDDLTYFILNKKINKHLNTGGKIISTRNSYIKDKHVKIKKISLSRFELLTTHLSNECSTTEL